jgi:hypothetical protein
MDAYAISEDSESFVSESTARPKPHRSKTHRPSNNHRRQASSSSIHTHSDTSSIYPSSHHRFAGDGDLSRSPRRESLTRAHTTQELALLPPRPVSNLTRSNTTPVDLDLAYGEYHPSSLAALDTPRNPPAEQQELSSLVTKARMLLDEANCAQHSVTAIIGHLQKNPDAMAAVALTLAEISNIASKLAPGALAAFKSSAPAVFALLASPQFLIAAGVGVGITIVALGGYKIIKKIKARNTEEEGMDEMMEIGGDVNCIENWRRGIADVEMESQGTTVEGEFITPEAARMSGMITPIPDRVKDIKTGKSKSKSKSKTKVSGRSEKSSSSKSEVSSSSRRSSKSEKSDKKEKKKDKEGKEKKPSPLRLMFR